MLRSGNEHLRREEALIVFMLSRFGALTRTQVEELIKTYQDEKLIEPILNSRNLKGRVFFNDERTIYATDPRVVYDKNKLDRDMIRSFWIILKLLPEVDDYKQMIRIDKPLSALMVNRGKAVKVGYFFSEDVSKLPLFHRDDGDNDFLYVIGCEIEDVARDLFKESSKLNMNLVVAYLQGDPLGSEVPKVTLLSNEAQLDKLLD